MKKRLVIIGAGPAGLAVAISAVKFGISPDDMLIIERESELGGVLNQCIHNGFGEHSIGKALTGTEYAERFIDEALRLGIPYLTDSTVLSVSKEKEITFVSTKMGYSKIKADAIVFAIGCRERSQGSLHIAGTRPAGVFSAGTVQRFINIEGYLPGKNAILFGSGDIGLVTARRLALEGANVIGAYEMKSYPTGSYKNVKECLTDFDIPFYTNKTITKILGKERIEGVVVCDTDDDLRAISGTEQLLKCDTLVLSLGLIPDNIITKEAGITIDKETGGAEVNQYYETDLDGVFVSGNVLHIHDLVDYITLESELVGKGVTAYLLGKIPPPQKQIRVSHNDQIKYTVPQKFSFPAYEDCDNVIFYYRALRVMKKAKITLRADEKELVSEVKSNITPSQLHQIKISKEILKEFSIANKITLEATEV